MRDCDSAKVISADCRWTSRAFIFCRRNHKSPQPLILGQETALLVLRNYRHLYQPSGNLQLPIIPHYVNFRRRGNPRRCWTCVDHPGAGRRRPTVCPESAKIARNRWGSRRQFGPFLRLRWDEEALAGDVVQLRGRRPQRGNLGRQPTRNCHRSRLFVRGIGASRIPLKQGFHPRLALAKIGHVRADSLKLVIHVLPKAADLITHIANFTM